MMSFSIRFIAYILIFSFFNCEYISQRISGGNPYTNEQEGFSLRYPKGWKINDIGVFKSSVLFIKMDKNLQIKPNINVLIKDPSNLSLHQYVAKSKNGMDRNIDKIGYRFKKFTSERMTTLYGNSAYETDYLFEENGRHYKGRVLYSLIENRMFIIFYTALESDFHNFENDYSLIIKTFRVKPLK